MSERVDPAELRRQELKERFRRDREQVVEEAVGEDDAAEVVDEVGYVDPEQLAEWTDNSDEPFPDDSA